MFKRSCLRHIFNTDLLFNHINEEVIISLIEEWRDLASQYPKQCMSYKNSINYHYNGLKAFKDSMIYTTLNDENLYWQIMRSIESNCSRPKVKHDIKKYISTISDKGVEIHDHIWELRTKIMESFKDELDLWKGVPPTALGVGLKCA